LKNFYRSPYSKVPPQYRKNSTLSNIIKISYLWDWTMLNFCGIVAAILKMETGRNFSMSGINSGRWNQTMLNLCGIMATILKMATGRNLSMSGIHSGHHNLLTYEMALKSDNVEFNIVQFQR
jgi:hypothetical protein